MKILNQDVLFRRFAILDLFTADKRFAIAICLLLIDNTHLLILTVMSVRSYRVWRSQNPSWLFAPNFHPVLPAWVKHNFQCCVLFQERGKLQEDLLFVNDWCLTGHNKMVQQTSWQAIYMCIFVVKTLALWSLY